MIDQGVTAALVACDANRNGNDSHTSGTGRPVQVACECTYPDFLKCQTLNFKGDEGVVGLNKYCPRGEIKKLESEMWNLKVKGTDVVAYSQRFQELALMCDRMFSEEIDKVKRYVDSLPDTIHGSVMATKPKTMQDAIEFATKLMNKKINTWAERQVDNKRTSDDTIRNNHQQPNKRQNTKRAYATGNGNKRAYEGPRPRANQRGNVCYECAAQGYFKRECPKLKNNNNRGNQVGNAKAQAKVYAVGKAGANPDNNVFTGLAGYTTHSTSGISNRFDTWCCTCSTGTISISTILNEGTNRATTRTYGQRLHKTKFLTLGSSGLVCQEERWVFPDVHRLQGIEQTDSEEPKKEHEGHLRQILNLLKKEELYANFSKCEFWISRVQFLGHVIDCQGIHIDPAKIEPIKDWASPKTPIEIRQFLGLTGYYRRFIERFSKIAKSMTKLTQKDVKFDWGDKQEAAFQQTKQKLWKENVVANALGRKEQVLLEQQRRWLELLSDYDCEIRYHPGKANVVADALSRKEQEPLKVRALFMTIGLDLPKQILNAQTEARKL
nr:reverse transcriptase domain-containing protein [Tanacetum cinerariifolium]